MASLHFEVDTTPMAQTVDTARGHLTGVTVAVTAMEAAVIAAEKASSKKICENVDKGFYMLVKSQTSQKAVAAYTEMISNQITMLQLAKAFDNIKRQMESDFNMITRRYAKLFQSLNKALEIRIKELDRLAMQLAEIKKTFVFDKLKDSSSMLLSVSAEAIPFAQTALAGKLKQKTMDTLLTLKESANENNSYSEQVDNILIKKGGNLSGDYKFRYLPAIFFTSDSLLNPGDTIENIYTVKTDVWQNTASIISEINRIQKDLPWSTLDKNEKDSIRREFLALCEKEADDERLSNEIRRLFDESSWEVLHK